MDYNFDDDSIKYIQSLIRGERERIKIKTDKLDSIESEIYFRKERGDF